MPLTTVTLNEKPHKGEEEEEEKKKKSSPKDEQKKEKKLQQLQRKQYRLSRLIIYNNTHIEETMLHPNIWWRTRGFVQN